VVIAVIVVFFRQAPFGPGADTSTREAIRQEETRIPTGTLELRDSNYSLTSDPAEASIIIVNAPGAQAARPIDVTVKVNNKEVWKETIKADELNCADDNTCSLSAPNRQLWTTWLIAQDKVEFSATDAANNLLALLSLLAAE